MIGTKSQSSIEARCAGVDNLSMFTLLILVVALMNMTEARVTAEICQVKPPERHCQIEWAVRDRWPHRERWVYDWRLRICHTIRWADHCPDPKVDTNNFATECECLNECSGWA